MGEILSLKWINVDLKKKCIDLTKTKNSHPRKIDMTEKLYTIFCNMKVADVDTNDYVFTNNKTKTRYKDIHEGFKNALKNADIQNFRFHDLRHTVATVLVANNVDIVVIKDILGHRNIQTTMRYAHSLPELKKKAINVLNDLANG